MTTQILGKGSLTRQLLVTILLPTIVFISLAAAVAIWVAGRSINSLYDQQMQTNASILMAYLQFEVNEYADEDKKQEDDDDTGDSVNDDDDDDDEEFDSGEEISDELIEIVSEIETQQDFTVNYRLRVNSRTIFTSGLVRNFPRCIDGFSNFNAGDATGSARQWRCFHQTQTVAHGDVELNVEVFEPVSTRKKAIRELIIATFLPIFVLPLITLLAILWAVRGAMRRLRQVSNAVARRSVNHLERLSRDDKPRELLPVVDSVNNLLSGIEVGITREKQFTDDAAHELRTPISSIKMLEQLMRRDNKDSALEDHLNKLRDAILQCQMLIEQLLRFARIQTLPLADKEWLDIGALLQEQLGLLSPQLTEKSLSVDLEHAITNGKQEPTRLLANKAAVTLLINNLLSNAIKFNRNEGVLYIRLSTHSLRIEDDGPGIEHDDRHRVFDRFYRAAATRSVPGTGLGLALSRWVANAHHCTLTVEDPLIGQGAALLLTFPE